MEDCPSSPEPRRPVPPRPWSSSAAAGPRPTAAASSDDAPMDASPGRDDAVLSIGALLAPPSVVDVVTQLLGSIVLRGTPSPAPPARTDAAASDGGAGGDDVQSLAARLGAVSLTPTPAEALPAATPPVALVWSTEMELHAGPGAHVERPERHAAVVRRLIESGLAARCAPLAPRRVTDEEALRAHSAAHLASVDAAFDAAAAAAAAAAGGGGGGAYTVSGDNYACASTGAAARLAAGCAVAAALAVARGEARAAFAVVRPPGHHAACARAQGFCFLNNASVAALAVLAEPGYSRVLILDWDGACAVHHGNGIEAIHYADPRVLYVSLHRHGGGFYPGTGAPGDVGAGPGAGRTLNVAWPGPGVGDADYAAAFAAVVLPVAAAFRPQLVLIAAGFDAAAGDPLGGCALTPAHYGRMAAQLAALPSCGGRVVALLEGGYNLQQTAACAEATLRALLDGGCGGGGGGGGGGGEGAAATPPQPRPGCGGRLRRGTAPALLASARALRPYWPAALAGAEAAVAAAVAAAGVAEEEEGGDEGGSSAGRARQQQQQQRLGGAPGGGSARRAAAAAAAAAAAPRTPQAGAGRGGLAPPLA